MSESERKFALLVKGKYSLDEKDALRNYVSNTRRNIRQLWNLKLNYSDKTKKHTKKVPREGYIAKAVR